MTYRNDGVLSPNEVMPIHWPDDRVKLTQLTEDMCQDGWQGRPLLIQEIRGGMEYLAWTGSHRIQAAIAAGVKEIPVVVIDPTMLREYCRVNGISHLELWADIAWDDDIRLEILRDMGDTEAVALMKEEVNQNGH